MWDFFETLQLSLPLEFCISGRGLFTDSCPLWGRHKHTTWCQLTKNINTPCAPVSLSRSHIFKTWNNKMRFSYLTYFWCKTLKKKKKKWIPDHQEARQTGRYFFFKVQIIPKIHLVDRSRQTIRAIKQKASLNGRTVQENPDLDISVSEHGEHMMGSFQGHLANPPGIDKPRSEEFTLNRCSVLGI